MSSKNFAVGNLFKFLGWKFCFENLFHQFQLVKNIKCLNIYKSTQNRGLFLLFATHRKTLLHLKPNNWIQKYHFVLKQKKKKKVLFCFIFPSPVTTYSHSYNHASDKTSIAFRTWDCTIYVTEVAKDFIQFCNRPFLSILKVNPDHN